MAAQFNLFEFNIAQHFASALINGDYTGLDDSDEAELNDYLLDLDLTAGHWTMDDDEPSFSQCDVTGLHADCASFSYYELVSG